MCSFYEPKEKQQILNRNLYNYFSSRKVFSHEGQLVVSYNMMPFLYNQGNRVIKVFQENTGFFDDTTDFSEVSRFIRNNKGDLALPYNHKIYYYHSGYAIIASENNDRSFAIYDSTFRLIKKTYMKGVANSFYPTLGGESLVYMKSFKVDKDRQWFVYLIDFDSVFN